MPAKLTPASQQSVLIYLHGFISSPQSEKAQETLAYCQQHRPDIRLIIPELSNYSDIAEQQLIQIMEAERGNKLGLIGSSLGGLFSAWLSAVYGCKAVLVNPGVFNAMRFSNYLGENTNMYSQETFVLEPRHVDVIKRLGAYEPDHNKLMLLLQTGDETLDYRDAVSQYAQAKIIIEQGGNHRFEGYQNHIKNIIEFLAL